MLYIYRAGFYLKNIKMKIRKLERTGNEVGSFLLFSDFICYNYLWEHDRYDTRHFQNDAQKCINYVKRKQI